MREAARFFAMTPREIHWTLLSRRAESVRRTEDAVFLSRLVALAVHDPARLPPLPASPLPEMTADEMKQRLLSWRRKDESP